MPAQRAEHSQSGFRGLISTPGPCTQSNRTVSTARPLHDYKRKRVPVQSVAARCSTRAPRISRKCRARCLDPQHSQRQPRRTAVGAHQVPLCVDPCGVIGVEPEFTNEVTPHDDELPSVGQQHASRAGIQSDACLGMRRKPIAKQAVAPWRMPEGAHVLTRIRQAPNARNRHPAPLDSGNAAIEAPAARD
jgi:hypothetical protein